MTATKVFLLYMLSLVTSQPQPVTDPVIIDCTADVKRCPDGSFVQRNSGNKCLFFDCPKDNGNVGCGINHCSGFYDGCNRCGCRDQYPLCTQRFCETKSTAFCTACESGYVLDSNTGICTKYKVKQGQMSDGEDIKDTAKPIKTIGKVLLVFAICAVVSCIVYKMACGRKSSTEKASLLMRKQVAVPAIIQNLKETV